MKEKIIFILVNLGVGAILVWLSILFIEKVYLKIRPKDKKQLCDIRKRKMEEKIIRILQFSSVVMLIIYIYAGGYFYAMEQNTKYLIAFLIAMCSTLSFIWATNKKEGLT